MGTKRTETRVPCSNQTRELIRQHKSASETYDEVLERLAMAVEPEDPRDCIEGANADHDTRERERDKYTSFSSTG